MVKVQDHQGIQDKPEAPEELGGGCLRTWLMKRLMKKNGFKSSPRKFPLNLTWQISLLLQSLVLVQRASASAFFRGMKSTSAEGGAIIVKKVAETMMRTTNIHLVLVVFSVFLWEEEERKQKQWSPPICPLTMATVPQEQQNVRKKSFPLSSSWRRHVS